MVEVLPIETPPLGDRSYLVHDGEAALVIDPQRDIDRVIALAADAGVRVTHVAETHVHNDYVTGGLALARAAGAAYLVNADDPVSFDRTPVSDGDRVEVGGMRVRALATPGHTYTHLAYVVEAAGDAPGDGVAGVFTGGSLLYGATGRTDLLGPDATVALTRAQWASARRARPGTARRGPDLPHPRFRQLLLGHAVGRRLVHHRPGEAGQPGAHPGRGLLPGIAAGRAGRLARLLRPHGPGEPRRAGRPRPVTTASGRCGRAAPAHRGG